jgi:DNA invertase Pin-like site-specific DNA recombinase
VEQSANEALAVLLDLGLGERIQIGDDFRLCGLVEARVIDLDGVYNPCRPNDRLLLGMKGSISEFELGVLRARMLDAARSKASREHADAPHAGVLYVGKVAS